MSVHVAILRRPYLDAVLAGTKTRESRLTKTAVAPLGHINPGERIFLKQSGGPFRAVALAGRVDEFRDLTPADLNRLQKRFRASVGGDTAYWQSKHASKFACFIELLDVHPVPNAGPTYKTQYMRAWYVLPDTADPVAEVTLTAGAVRNRYVSIPRATRSMHAAPLTLLLPDDTRVRTELVKSGQVRWRGWAPYFEAHGVQPGDRVRFLALGRRRYRVSFPDEPASP